MRPVPVTYVCSPAAGHCNMNGAAGRVHPPNLCTRMYSAASVPFNRTISCSEYCRVGHTQLKDPSFSFLGFTGLSMNLNNRWQSVLLVITAHSDNTIMQPRLTTWAGRIFLSRLYPCEAQ